MLLSCVTALMLLASGPIDAALGRTIASLIAPRTSQVHTIEYRSVPRELTGIDPRASVRLIGEPKPFYRGTVDLPIELTAADGRRTIYFVRLCVRTYDSAAVAGAMIERHAALAGAPIAMQRVETTELAEEPLSACGSMLAGMRSRQIIGAGRVITRAMIEPVPVVAAGTAVSVRVTRDNVRISLTGRVREDGWKGSVVAVELGEAKRRLRARVVDPMNVEVVE